MSAATASSKVEKLQQQLEAARSELERLEAKVAEAVKQRRQVENRVHELRDAIHVQLIKDLANVEGAVCIGTTNQVPRLDDLCGTVIKVGRSYAVVRFENGENWKVPFSELCRIEDKAKRPRQFASFKL
jgi:septal ring factor EnvC (AmiA/AmiB activator)